MARPGDGIWAIRDLQDHLGICHSATWHAITAAGVRPIIRWAMYPRCVNGVKVWNRRRYGILTQSQVETIIRHRLTSPGGGRPSNRSRQLMKSPDLPPAS